MPRTTSFLVKHWQMALTMAVVVVLAAIGIWFWYWRGHRQQYDPEAITLDQNDPRVISEQRVLNGLWRETSQGEPVVLAGDRWAQYMWDSPPVHPFLGTIRLDPTTTPKRIDLLVDAAKVRKGIYKLEGHTLTLCLGETRHRPTAIPAGLGLSEGVYFRRTEDSTTLMLLRPELFPPWDGRLPQPEYHHHPDDPGWLREVVQFHGHLGPSVVAGAKTGMIGLRAVDAKGYFDVEVICEGPFAKPPQACFLDGLQVATGATMGKRTLTWVQADKISVQIKNTRTGKVATLHPKPDLLELLASFKTQAKMAGQHEEQPHDDRLEALARKIATMHDKEAVIITVGSTSKQ
jgi:uncharacterized protein (TIGR03067 family)